MRNMALLLGLTASLLVPNATAQSGKYPNMAPIEQYRMDRDAEIQMARSSAPEAVSKDATVLVLGQQDFETAMQGTNGFVCWVERSWMEPFDAPEYWNPKVRGAQCANRQAAQAIIPILHLRTRMVLAGKSNPEVLAALKAAYASKQLPGLEVGGMVFMMAKSAYLFDADDHNGPHVMFYTPLTDSKDWGADATNSPVFAGPYWFWSSKDASLADGLPPILVFAIAVPNWSDGTTAPMAH